MGMNTEQKKMLNLGTASEYTYLTTVTVSAFFSIIPLPFASPSEQLHSTGAADRLLPNLNSPFLTQCVQGFVSLQVLSSLYGYREDFPYLWVWCLAGQLHVLRRSERREGLCPHPLGYEDPHVLRF